MPGPPRLSDPALRPLALQPHLPHPAQPARPTPPLLPSGVPSRRPPQAPEVINTACGSCRCAQELAASTRPPLSTFAEHIWALSGLWRTLRDRRWSCVRQWAWRTRVRSRSKLARPNIWRFNILILLTVPSTRPELCSRVSPARTASWSRRSPAVNRCSSGRSSASTAVSQSSRRSPWRPHIISANAATWVAAASSCRQWARWLVSFAWRSPCWAAGRGRISG
jgi:hypothetical protein